MDSGDIAVVILCSIFIFFFLATVILFVVEVVKKQTRDNYVLLTFLFLSLTFLFRALNLIFVVHKDDKRPKFAPPTISPVRALYGEDPQPPPPPEP